MAEILRKDKNQIPIIFLTAKDTENDMLTGFSVGGERWPNKLRGFSAKEGGTGFYEQHQGNKPTLPSRNKRSVWTVPTRGFKGAHFATFPPALIRTCIEAGCPPDGVVLDPVMGACTTAVVAQELGRSYVGIELNGDYVRMAQERIDGA